MQNTPQKIRHWVCAELKNKNSDVQEMVYLNQLIKNCLVNVGKCDFLSKQLHIYGGQWFPRRRSPPPRKL